ncbi:HAD family hydrolase [Mesorhizobium sp. YM1C-6-2]|uniref:HAD family hydrolase n=1 Tax=Mesorhizobium sp. YM1C-6-2 TaxID=1827501 RepID=UPI000EF1F2C9|nr:HAD family hydrolase [Mesorhizobium sp. YM1C-6-2]RLP27136.1 HAD family hydrolase [Mesorhizobium sp. YM1C-6-2]
MTHDVVFLLDVDNTLLDNDRVADDLRAHLTGNFGRAGELYWRHFERLREELGYADYLGALQRYRADLEENGEAAHRLLSVSGFLIDYPFADRLYPGALAVLDRLAKTGPTVILSDGDVVFQPRKVQRSGIWKAVDGRVLIFVHKEEMLATVEREFPARRYVLIDDKQRILDAVKKVWGERLVTVFPRQGHYALDPANAGKYRAPDVTVEGIGDLLGLDIEALARR